MFAGIGIDMIEVDRITKFIEKEFGFKELVFSTKEIVYCETKTNKFENYAVRFAAKEAFFKAIGTGWVSGTLFNEVEITNDELGKPRLTLLGETHRTMASLGINKILVSMSHLNTIAAAVVVIEK